MIGFQTVKKMYALNVIRNLTELYVLNKDVIDRKEREHVKVLKSDSFCERIQENILE